MKITFGEQVARAHSELTMTIDCSSVGNCGGFLV